VSEVLKRKLDLEFYYDDHLYFINCPELDIYGAAGTEKGAFDDFMVVLTDMIKNHKGVPENNYSKNGKIVRKKFLSLYGEGSENDD
jgi:hypothetical protein